MLPSGFYFTKSGTGAFVLKTFAGELLRQNEYPEALHPVATDMSSYCTRLGSDYFDSSRVVCVKLQVIKNVPGPRRRRKGRPLGADTLDVAQNRVNWRENEGEKWGADAPATMRDGKGVQDVDGASCHPRMEGCRRGKEVVPKLVRLGERDARVDRKIARAAGPSGRDGRRALG